MPPSFVMRWLLPLVLVYLGIVARILQIFLGGGGRWIAIAFIVIGVLALFYFNLVQDPNSKADEKA